MTSLRVLIMSLTFMSGIIVTGLVGPNRTSIEAEYDLTHSQFGAGLAVIRVVVSGGLLLAAVALHRFEVGEGDFHLEDARLDDGEVLMRVDADKRGVLAEGDHEYLLTGFRRQ